jgi:TPR repeat protein
MQKHNLNSARTIYLDGDGVAQDIPKGVGLLAKAAEQGHAKAQCTLGLFYNQVGGGMNTPKGRKGVGLLEKAAGQGIADAQTALGLMYLHDKFGLPLDKPKGMGLLEKAAEQGGAAAALELSRIHCMGLPQDKQAAKAFWQNAAWRFEKDSPDENKSFCETARLEGRELRRAAQTGDIKTLARLSKTGGRAGFERRDCSSRCCCERKAQCGGVASSEGCSRLGDRN